MVRFVATRVVSAVVTLFIVITATFFMMFLVPGGPFLSEKTTAATEALMEKKYGLNDPVPVQYARYLKNFVQGDLGISYKRKGYTVTEIIAEKFPVSARLGGVAICVSLLVGIPAGILAAFKRNTIIDRIIMVICTVGFSFPSFVISTLLLYIIGMWLKLLPTIGLENPRNYIMPVIALSLAPTSYITRFTRSSMLDVNGLDYLKTARAKGLSERVVLFKHALRNAIIPVITYLGPLVVSIITGGFITERIFSIPGLGRYFIESIGSRDYPVIMGTTIFFASLIIISNFVVDVLYRVVDPRIKIS